jgi:hypothetical protein
MDNARHAYVAIDTWCRSVWNAFRGCQPTIAELLREHQLR